MRNRTSHRICNLLSSPDGAILVIIDEGGRCQFVDVKSGNLVHHFSLKGRVSVSKFSPNGVYLATGVGKLLHVWKPKLNKFDVSLMHLQRTIGHFRGDITCLDWSSDSEWIVVGSNDLAVRVVSLSPIEGYRVPILVGHRESIVGVFFTGIPTEKCSLNINYPMQIISISKAALFQWTFKRTSNDEKLNSINEGAFKLESKYYFNQIASKCTAVDYHKGSSLLVVGFSTGVFDLYKIPTFEKIQSLVVSNVKINTITFNLSGKWLAIGCEKNSQLLVWEWSSKTYIIKQQGHLGDVTSLAFHPKSTLIATGSNDNKVKVWNSHSGTCLVTFNEHIQTITGVEFVPPLGYAIVSSSGDGTIKAFDLTNFRMFRSFSCPNSTKLVCLAVNTTGEVICSCSNDKSRIFLWNFNNAQLMDVLEGHQAPISCLAFGLAKKTTLLVSGSWDNTVRLWDIHGSSSSVESLNHNYNVVALAIRPDGAQLVSSTSEGQLNIWGIQEGELLGIIENRCDVDRKSVVSDFLSENNFIASQCFTSLAYFTDGTFLIAGGRSEYVFIYNLADRTLLSKFMIIDNGILSKKITSPSTFLNTRKPLIGKSIITVAPTGYSWCVATNEGVHVYDLEHKTLCDPTDISNVIIPEKIGLLLKLGLFEQAMLHSLILNDQAVIERCIMTIPTSNIMPVCKAIPHIFFANVYTKIEEKLLISPHLEYILKWIYCLSIKDGAEKCFSSKNHLKSHNHLFWSVLDPLQSALRDLCEGNIFSIAVLRAWSTDNPPKVLREEI
jgi:periodic tryptophan protein 2